MSIKIKSIARKNQVGPTEPARYFIQNISLAITSLNKLSIFGDLMQSDSVDNSDKVNSIWVIHCKIGFRAGALVKESQKSVRYAM